MGVTRAGRGSCRSDRGSRRRAGARAVRGRGRVPRSRRGRRRPPCRGVRSEGGGDPAAGKAAAAQREVQRRRRPLGPLRGEVRLPELGPHPAPVDDLGHGVHVEVAVREGRDARADHLGAGQPGAQHHVPPGEVGLDGPDDVVEPLLGGQVLGESAQRDHGRVRVAVDQPGEGDLAACVDAVGGGHRGPCRGGGHGVDDSAAYDDGRVLLEADPPTVVVHEDGAAADDEIGGPGVPGVSGGPGGLG